MAHHTWRTAMVVLVFSTVATSVTVAGTESTVGCAPLTPHLKLTPDQEAYVRKNCSSPDLADVFAKWQRDTNRKLSPDVQALILASYLQSEFFHVVERGDPVAKVRMEGVAALREYLDGQLLKPEERPLVAIHAERLGRAGFVVLRRSQYGELRTEALPAGAGVFLSGRFVGNARDRLVVLAGAHQARVMAETTSLCDVKIEVRPGQTSDLRCGPGS